MPEALRTPAPRLGLVVPCFNEEAALPETLARLEALLGELIASGTVAADSGVTYVDDGSRDRTWRLIEAAGAAGLHVSGLKLAANVGHQRALLAGLLNAPGDVLISLDADLQDDLAAIPAMLAAHARGADIVYGVRSRRDSDTAFKRSTARGYYWLLRRLGIAIVPDHADFRLMSRAAIAALAEFGESNLFLRGLVPLLGFSTETVVYDRQARTAGVTKYSLARMVSLAIDGVTAFSPAPLNWITVLGLLGSIGSVLAALWALYVRLFTHKGLPGWASTVIPMYFLGSVQLLALGIMGAYLSRIYTETKRRPRFIIERRVGDDS
jgi:polyisoprenyl-phosphate glycosyltransferase